MKHIKLFENWAEENARLPEWLDPNREPFENAGLSIRHRAVRKLINNVFRLDFSQIPYDEDDDYYSSIYNMLGDKAEIIREYGNDVIPIRVNFKSFSDYNFFKKSYNYAYIDQRECIYRLRDLIGSPRFIEILSIEFSEISSMKGLNKEISDEVSIIYGELENLKYCPKSLKFDFEHNPLLSYYGITSRIIANFEYNLCGNCCYFQAGYNYTNIPTLEQLNDPEFNAGVFCYFPYKVIGSDHYSGTYLNPWVNIYEDPNEVENYEFLFVPFYFNSENFRTKAKEYIKNLDAGNLDRSDLW